MEKRSRRRIRDLVALAAFQGLSENEIGCARISMMARSDAAPFKGRIQKRKTNHLQIITFGLQRTAGPYKSAITRPQRHSAQMFRDEILQILLSDCAGPKLASRRITQPLRPVASCDGVAAVYSLRSARVSILRLWCSLNVCMSNVDLH